MRGFALLQLLLLASVPALVVQQGAAAAQAGDAERLHFDVPAGGLGDALNGFARQAGITLSFDPTLTNGRHSQALKGSRRIADGLSELLGGHPLKAVQDRLDAYSVQPDDSAHWHLPAVTVTAQDEPMPDLVARTGTLANGTDTPLIDTPRSVAVVTREQMQERAARTVEQSLRYSPGVLTEVAGSDPRFASITVRGFAPDEYLDGLQLPRLTRYSGWLIEPQGLEKVELLKGPAVGPYDQNAPGGIVSMVSKRPTRHALREIGLGFGNQGRVEGNFDLGGSLDAQGSTAFRLNGLRRNGGGQTDLARDDRSFLALALNWTPSARTSLTLLADFTSDRMTPKSIWPEFALLRPNPNGPIARSRAIGEPGFDRFERRATSFGYLLEHRFDGPWSLRQNLRVAALDLDYRQVQGSDFADDMRSLNRSVTTSRDQARSAMLDNQFMREFRTGSVTHSLLLGADLRHYGGSTTGNRDLPAPPIDAFAPVYGALPVLPEIDWAVGGNRWNQVGLYVQDQMRWRRWTLSLGTRVQSSNPTIRFELDSRPANNVGLVYQAANGVAPYLSYATTLDPSERISGGTYGKPLADLGRQLEVGLKVQPPGTDAMLSLAAFDLRKPSAWTEDPNERIEYRVPSGGPFVFNFVRPAGMVRMRGLEFEAHADLSRHLRLQGGLSWLDAEVVCSHDPRELGMRPPESARHTAALWLDYRFGGPKLHGWSVGGGLRHVGRVPASIDNGLFNPAYTLLDAALRYERNHHAFALHGTNLFDKRHVAGAGRFFGQARTLQASFGYRW